MIKTLFEQFVQSGGKPVQSEQVISDITVYSYVNIETSTFMQASILTPFNYSFEHMQDLVNRNMLKILSVKMVEF